MSFDDLVWLSLGAVMGVGLAIGVASLPGLLTLLRVRLRTVKPETEKKHDGAKS